MKVLEDARRALRHLDLEELHAIVGWAQDHILDLETRECRVAEPATANALGELPPMRLDEYMEFEKSSQIRHEYVNGITFDMNGPTVAHVRITGQLFAALKSHLRGGPCEVFATDVRLLIRSEEDEIVYYPDIIVACNREEWGRDYVCNPKLVVEVLSASTRRTDKREKSMTYRGVRSIEEYALLEQVEHRLTVYRRADNWRGQRYLGVDAVAEFRSISLSVPLAQIYAGTLATE